MPARSSTLTKEAAIEILAGVAAEQVTELVLFDHDDSELLAFLYHLMYDSYTDEEAVAHANDILESRLDSIDEPERDLELDSTSLLPPTGDD